MEKIGSLIAYTTEGIKSLVGAMVDMIQNHPKTKHLTDGEVVDYTLSHIIFIFYEKENKDNSDILYTIIEKSKYKYSNDMHCKWDLMGRLKLANSDEDVDINFRDLTEMEDLHKDLESHLISMVVPSAKKLKDKLVKICIDNYITIR